MEVLNTRSAWVFNLPESSRRIWSSPFCPTWREPYWATCHPPRQRHSQPPVSRQTWKRWCAWDWNRRLQDGRHIQFHWAIMAHRGCLSYVEDVRLIFIRTIREQTHQKGFWKGHPASTSWMNQQLFRQAKYNKKTWNILHEKIVDGLEPHKWAFYDVYNNHWAGINATEICIV